jgi:cytochrome c-type biogenesis protein CcmH
LEPGLLLWVIFAAMTAGAALVVLVPLARAPAAATGGEDAAVYRDQLAELDRDRQRGLIDPAEAGAAHAEIARRFLRATGTDAPAAAGRPGLRRLVAILSLIALPAFTVALYVSIGAPDLPGRPLAARLAPETADETDVPAMIARVERHLAEEPDDLAGWRVIVPVYMQLGAFDRAAAAWREILRLEGATPDTETRLAEALIMAGDGEITPEARALLESAIAADPAAIAARYYLARALGREGRAAEADALLAEALDTAPADAPWRAEFEVLRAEIAGRPPAAADVAALPPDAQAAMIAGMVDGLAARLEENPADGEGWVMLVRSYLVLDRPDDARAALAEGRAALSADLAALAALDAVAADLDAAPGTAP